MSKLEKDQSLNLSLQRPLADRTTLQAQDYQTPLQGQPAPERLKLKAAHWVLMFISLLAFVFIVFVMLSKSVQVSAYASDLDNPEKRQNLNSSIAYHSKIKLKLGNRVLLLAGSHQVTVGASGYVSQTKLFEVSRDKNQQFDVELKRLPGRLKINVPADLQARIAIDGQDFGNVPAEIDGVEAGYRELVVDAPLYRPFSQTVLVEGKAKLQSIEATLEPAWAEYSISSEPEKAKIFIDGQAVGVTPAKIKVEEGTRQLRLEAPLYKEVKRELAVTANDEITLSEFQLEPADGRLSLDSVPQGAAIIVNDEFRGLTPMQLELAPNQLQELKLYKAGYKLAEQKYQLNPADNQAENIELVADLINVKLSVSPRDAELIVDGVSKGRGSKTLSLSSLPHTIKAKKAGYVTQTTQLVPTRTSQQVVNFSLLTHEQHYWAQIPNQYSSRLGHEMKLFRELGTVSLGSSRKEDGRRANEVVYQAELTKPFYVALHETTNKQFRQFKPSHNAGNYKGKSLDANRSPALNVSWQQAAQYCNWLSKKEGLDPFYQTVSGFVSGYNPDANGYRLLTEVEWAWLARNTDNGVLTYPWGNRKSAAAVGKVDNLADETAAEIIAFTLPDYRDGYKGPSPVGRFKPNHRGLFDMGGNAAEWVNDWYSAKASSEAEDPKGRIRDPLGPDNGEFHVIRGASWARGHLPQLRLAYRDYGAKGSHDVGFRVARYAGLNQSRKRVASN